MLYFIGACIRLILSWGFIALLVFVLSLMFSFTWTTGLVWTIWVIVQIIDFIFYLVKWFKENY